MIFNQDESWFKTMGFAYIVYYNDNNEHMIEDCLEDINENVVLLDSPHFCKKVFFYLNKLEIVNM